MHDLPESSCDVRTIQEMPRHRDITTAMTRRHVLKKDGRVVKSPVGEWGREG